MSEKRQRDVIITGLPPLEDNAMMMSPAAAHRLSSVERA